jgi:hypothetical protein
MDGTGRSSGRDLIQWNPIAVPQFFLILLVWIQDRVFVLLQASLGRPLQVCESVVADRYAF